jgi:hypothetical protein
MKEVDGWRIYKEKANAGASNNATTTIWLHTINVESFLKNLPHRCKPLQAANSRRRTNFLVGPVTAKCNTAIIPKNDTIVKLQDCSSTGHGGKLFPRTTFLRAKTRAHTIILTKSSPKYNNNNLIETGVPNHS